MTTAAELASYASSFPSFRNKFINGNFDIWQRGTSQTSSGYGSADRWKNVNSGSTKTASQQAFTVGQTDVPGNPKYYLRHVVSSVAGAANNCTTQHRVEGVDTLSGQTATLSFWAKADANKNIATEISQDFGTGGSPSSRVDTIGVTTYNLTTSWQKFTATVSIPSINGKTIGTDGNDYLRILFFFDAGSDFNSRTNSLGQQSGTFDIAQVQLEEGTVATPFEHRPYVTELALCQRYAIMFGNNTVDSTGDGGHLGLGWIDTIDNFAGMIFLPTTMRERPLLTASGTDNFEVAYTDLSVSTVSGVNISQILGLTTKNLVFFTINSGQTNQHRQQPASFRYSDNSITDAFLLESEF